KELESPDEFAHWICPDVACVRVFADLGPRHWIEEMLGMRPTRTGFQAETQSFAHQRRHGVRARLIELDAISHMSEPELIRQLRAEATRTPFAQAGRDLLAWLDLFVGAPALVPARRR